MAALDTGESRMPSKTLRSRGAFICGRVAAGHAWVCGMHCRMVKAGGLKSSMVLPDVDPLHSLPNHWGPRVGGPGWGFPAPMRGRIQSAMSIRAAYRLSSATMGGRGPCD
jgi:hypothetical protein